MADIMTLAISTIIQVIILAPVLWFVGGKIADPKDVKFTDAVWIVVLGAVVSVVIGAFSLGIVGPLVGLVLWLFLIKHFFDTGWLKALAISIIASIVLLIVAAVLAVVGLGVALLV